MPEVHVYEPALCCSTGVCGPELDPRLVAFTADIAHVTEAGGRVVRHNLANDPHSFVSDEAVRAFLHVAGSKGLPLTTVDGVTVLTGCYPTREQLRRYAAVTTNHTEAPGSPAAAEPARPVLSLVALGGTGSTCAPDSGCC